MKKLSWVVIFALGASGCNSDSKNQEGAVPPPLSQIELYHSDYASLSAISGDTLSPFESLKPGLLSKIFGGMDGPAFVTYFNARVHYVYQQDADVSISPQSFTHTNWSKVATAESGVVMGAVNLGTALWFMGLLDRTPVTLFAGGETIPLNSSRTGLVILGPGYKERSMRLEDGSAANVPPAYRQATLMHEARHSDCTGGIRQQDLEVARAATNRDEFQEKYKRRSCGHLHTICTSGDYAGLSACDGEAWGAYSVGAVFAHAFAKSAPSYTDRQIMTLVAIDNYSRLTVSVSAMLRYELGDPDMSSTGLLD